MTIANAPQSKTVCIVFLSLKINVFGLMATAIALELTAPSSTHIISCTLDSQIYFIMVRLLFALSSVVDLLSLGYFYFSKQFNKVMYYVFYTYHWIISLISVIQAVQRIMNVGHCPLGVTLLGIIIALHGSFQFCAFAIMVGDFYRMMKFGYFGCNIVWTVMCYSLIVQKHSQMWNTAIGVIQVILSSTNFMILLSDSWIGKHSFLAINWHGLTLFSFTGQLICYLLVLVGKQQVIKNIELIFFMSVYTKLGLVELIAPFLILISFSDEYENPRVDFLRRLGKSGNKQRYFSGLEQIRI